jgi:hypothetical protein
MILLFIWPGPEGPAGGFELSASFLGLRYTRGDIPALYNQ